jgi:hypothetical protein
MREASPSCGGPFFANGTLEVTTAELAKLCVGAAMTFIEFFDGRSVADYETRLAFMEVQVAWFEHFIGPFDKGHLDGWRTFVALLRQR